MTDLSCSVSGCANNRDSKCCLNGIVVSGPNATGSDQTYCANFRDCSQEAQDSTAEAASPNPSLNIRCEAENCTYNQNRLCSADHVDIRTTLVNGGQVKTECSAFRGSGEDQ